jgi:hypothetical protein
MLLFHRFHRLVLILYPFLHSTQLLPRAPLNILPELMNPILYQYLQLVPQTVHPGGYIASDFFHSFVLLLSLVQHL